MNSPRTRIQLFGLLALASAALSASGCALGLGKSLHEYSMLDLEDTSRRPGAKEISVEKEQYVFLSLAFDTDYADEAYRGLMSQCPRGEILNVRARYSTDLGFLAYKNRLVVSALCATR